jgi:hypothetical protein
VAQIIRSYLEIVPISLGCFVLGALGVELRALLFWADEPVQSLCFNGEVGIE